MFEHSTVISFLALLHSQSSKRRHRTRSLVGDAHSRRDSTNEGQQNTNPYQQDYSQKADADQAVMWPPPHHSPTGGRSSLSTPGLSLFTSQHETQLLLCFARRQNYHNTVATQYNQENNTQESKVWPVKRSEFPRNSDRDAATLCEVLIHSRGKGRLASRPFQQYEPVACTGRTTRPQSSIDLLLGSPQRSAR
jgi:hypothetical protein